MSAEATAPTTETTDAPPAADTASDPATEVEKWKALARKHEQRAKDNADARSELDKLREATATEQEKAIIGARREAAQSFGSRLAEAQFRVAAAGLIGKDQLDGLLGVVDLKRFVDDNGDPDIDAISAAVQNVAPKSVDQGIPPDDHQGARPEGAAHSPEQDFANFLTGQLNGR